MWPAALGLTFHGLLAPDLGLAAGSSLFSSLAGARQRQLPALPGGAGMRCGSLPGSPCPPSKSLCLDLSASEPPKKQFLAGNFWY